MTQLELREKLIEVEELRKSGIAAIPVSFLTDAF